MHLTHAQDGKAGEAFRRFTVKCGGDIP
jgi:hypothetical protein